jgi:flagellum-specific peptidoglycan hydrolase FlgJ
MRDVGISLSFLIVIAIAISSVYKNNEDGDIPPPFIDDDEIYVSFMGSDKVKEYVIKYQELAIKDMERYGIPASVKIAQAILESGYGQSSLSKRGNNHFGIKCKRKNCSHVNCLNMCDDSCRDYFKTYSSPEKSFEDHSLLLSNSNFRYYSLIEECGYDFRCWAIGLKRKGYATSKTYDKKLIKLIEDYNLHILDKNKKFI